MGPLLSRLVLIDARIVFKALSATAILFISFSIVSFYSKRRSWLYLGSLLASGTGLLIWLSFFNSFFRSTALFDVELYFGLLVFSVYVIFDTQVIIEKIKSGNDDFIGHSAMLFTDAVALFVRLLLILSKDKKEKRKQR